MSPLQSVKLWLVGHVHLAKDALHIHVALCLFFGSALLFGWRIRGSRPWLLVLAAALIGEAWDLIDSVRYRTPIDLWANWKDIWNTMLWPSAIVLIARHSRMFNRR